MATSETKGRINVAIPKEIHVRASNVARLLGKDLQEAMAEAASDWVERNAGKARKRAAELLTSS